jgi:hypothetical protein
MSCELVNAYLARESGRLTGDIARRGRVSSPWVAVLEKDFFPDEMGVQITRVVYQRTIPTVGEGAGWTTVAASDTNATAANCRPTAAVLQSRYTTETAQLAEYVLDSDPICITDARTGYRFRDQVREIKRNFEKNVIDLWESRHRDQYVAAIPEENKLVFSGGALVPGTGGDFDPAATPDSQIHQDALDYVRWKLVHDGGGEEGAYGQVDGQPVFMVLMSSEQQRALIKGNADIRQDYRYADPKELLKPFGVKRVYGGFYHVIDDKAPRWNLEEGAWVEVPFYVADNNGIAIVNPDYETASYEDIIIYHPKVVKCLMQKPLSSIGNGTNFRAWDYSGEIQWVNEYDATCNKYRDNGFWSARLRAAYQALIPEYGYAIRVLRCPGALGTTACPTS